MKQVSLATTEARWIVPVLGTTPTCEMPLNHGDVVMARAYIVGPDLLNCDFAALTIQSGVGPACSACNEAITITWQRSEDILMRCQIEQDRVEHLL